MVIEVEPPGASKYKALIENVAPKFPQSIDRSQGAPAPNEQIGRSEGYSALFEGLRGFTLVELREASAYVQKKKHEINDNHQENPRVFTQEERAIWYSTDPIYAASVEKLTPSR